MQQVKRGRLGNDLVLADAQSLRSKLGYSDQQKLDEYLDSIRTIEKQIQGNLRGSNKPPPVEMMVTAMSTRLRANGTRSDLSLTEMRARRMGRRSDMACGV